MPKQAKSKRFDDVTDSGDDDAGDDSAVADTSEGSNNRS